MLGERKEEEKEEEVTCKFSLQLIHQISKLDEFQCFKHVRG